ncbi:MAG: hypothetical protein RLZZ124_1812 [Cyanobacteriota bacterium]
MSSPLTRSFSPSPRPWPHPHGLAAGLLLALAALPLPVLADGPGARHAELQPEEARALVRLTPAARRDYFDARRQLERRSSEQRLAQLRQLEDCLSPVRQRSAAETCLAEGRQRQWQQRRQWLGELMSLRQRYGLPDHRLRQERGAEWPDSWRGRSLTQDRWSPQPSTPQGWYPDPWGGRSQPAPPLTPQPGWSPQPSGWQAFYEALLPFGWF